MYTQFIINVLIGLIIFLIGRMVTHFILRKKHILLEGDKHRFLELFRDWKFMLLAFIALFVEHSLMYGLSRFVSIPIIFEIIYYLVFLVSGIILAKYFKSNYVPVAFGVTLLLMYSIVGFIIFVNHPSAIGRFGPERFIFALRDFVGRTNMVPIEIGVTWSAWSITRSITSISS